MAWITSPEAAAALSDAAGLAQDLSAAEALQRRYGLTGDQRAAVITQAELRAKAAARWGQPTGHLFFTRDGLEQATRPAVAKWRAERLGSFGVRAIADLGCGLGFESLAFAQAGLRVTAVEIDEATADLARANLAGTSAEVRTGDITDTDLLDPLLDGADALFLDPARRDPKAPRTIDGLSGHRVADPEDWSPSWSWIASIAARKPHTVVKVAPGIDHALIPDRGSAVWTAVDGDLVEASIWFPGFSEQPVRSAQSFAFGGHATLDSTMPTADTIAPIDSVLLDVAPVVSRSGLVTTLAATAGAHRIDEHIAYLSTEATPAPSPFYTSYRVIDAMPFDRRRIGDALASLDAGSLTVMKRGFAADTELLRKQWLKRCKGSNQLVVALTRLGNDPYAIICTR